MNGRTFINRCEAGAERVPVLHVKAFHPQDDHYGLSPLAAAASAVDVHNSASTWSKALREASTCRRPGSGSWAAVPERRRPRFSRV